MKFPLKLPLNISIKFLKEILIKLLTYVAAYEVPVKFALKIL